MSNLQWLQLVTWRSRPGNRTGPLMIAYGVATIAGRALVQTYRPLPVTVGIILMDGAVVAVLYLLLAFPTGRLPSRRDWLILGPAIIAFGPLELLWLSFLEVPDGLNVLAVWPDTGAADTVDWVQRVILVLVDVALVIVIVRRWLRASPPLRRVLAPVLGGVATITVGTFTLLWDKLEGTRTDFIVWLTAVTILALPVALLASLLRARLARSAVGRLLVELRHDDDPAHLRVALSRALGDPSL